MCVRTHLCPEESIGSGAMRRSEKNLLSVQLHKFQTNMPEYSTSYSPGTGDLTAEHRGPRSLHAVLGTTWFLSHYCVLPFLSLRRMIQVVPRELVFIWIPQDQISMCDSTFSLRELQA